jgi:hypothetical protein
LKIGKKKTIYALLALSMLTAPLVFFWAGRKGSIESLRIEETGAFEVPLGGGAPRYIKDVSLSLRPKSPGARVSMQLTDTVALKDRLLSETGWRIPAVLADGSPFFIPVSVQRQAENKTLKFWLKDLPLPVAAGEDKTPTLVFSYETAPSLEGLKNFVRARYGYAPRTLPLGRPAVVSLTLEVEKVHGLEDAGIAFFFRRDLADADIEVCSAPDTLLDLSTNGAYLFMGKVDDASLVTIKLRITARSQKPVRLERAVIVGGYLKDSPYPGVKVEGAKPTEQVTSSTVSYLGDMVFHVESATR